MHILWTLTFESSWAPKAEELEGAGGGAKAMAGDVCVRVSARSLLTL